MNDNQTTTPSKSKKNRKVTRITPDNLPTLYTNAIEIKLSVFDVILLFGEIREATDEEVTIRNDAKIVMSPQHAKALANLLTSRIELYEKEFGPIPGGRRLIAPEGMAGD